MVLENAMAGSGKLLKTTFSVLHAPWNCQKSKVVVFNFVVNCGDKLQLSGRVCLHLHIAVLADGCGLQHSTRSVHICRSLSPHNCIGVQDLSTCPQGLYYTFRHHHISYHIVVLKRQNRHKVGTDKPKLKVKMQSVSDDDFLKSHVLSWRRKVYSDWEVTFSGRAFKVYVISMRFAVSLPSVWETQYYWQFSLFAFVYSVLMLLFAQQEQHLYLLFSQ